MRVREVVLALLL